MKDTAEVRSNMWCDAKCVAIAAYAIENQATRIQYDINYSLQMEGRLIINQQLLDDMSAEIQNLTRYFESLKKEYEEYNSGEGQFQQSRQLTALLLVLLKVSIKCGIINMCSESYTVVKCNRVKGIAMSHDNGYLGAKYVEATLSSEAELPEGYEYLGFVFNPDLEECFDVFGPKVLTNDSGRNEYLPRKKH